MVRVVGFHNRCPVVEFQYRCVFFLRGGVAARRRVCDVCVPVRRGQMLNVRGEKVSEALFLHALKAAVSQWPGARLVDYCCAESGIMGNRPSPTPTPRAALLKPPPPLSIGVAGSSSGGSDPHYQVFLELKGVRNLTEEQRHKVTRQPADHSPHPAALLTRDVPPHPPTQLDACLQKDSAVYGSFRIKGSIGPMRVQLVAEGAFAQLRRKMMAFSGTSANTFKMQRVLRRKEDADFLLGKTVS